MFGNRRRELEAENRHLRARIARLVVQRDDARDGEQAAVKGTAVVSRHLAEAEAAAKRTADRNRQLTEQLELARQAQGDAEYAALQARLERALKACARYRAELYEPAESSVMDNFVEDAPPNVRRSLMVQLELSERARASLDTQLRRVQADHDFMCRERVTAAGNLAVPKPSAPSPKPGVAS